MKTFWSLLLVLTISVAITRGQDTVNTTEQKNTLNTISKSTDEIKKAVDTISKKEVTECKDCICDRCQKILEKDMHFGLWFFVLLPVVLFLLLVFYFTRWLKKDGYRISDALSQDMNQNQINSIQLAVNQRQALAGPEPVTPPPAIQSRSSSRLIAFFTGITTITLAVSLVSYYMFFAVKGLTPPDLESLWKVMAAMGIGVIPYASKVISQSTQN